MELRACALAALAEPDPEQKVTLALDLWARRAMLFIADTLLPPPVQLPGRPTRPALVTATEVPTRSPFTAEGHAALVHAIAHIEFNAINLALDAAWRFDGMPHDYHLDWLRVAAEEATHFSLLRTHLHGLGRDYGDFPAHDGLWLMCERTRHDPVARMALVPRTLEARGLDATPLIQAKLRRAATPEALDAARILDTILHDEVGHVAIGNRWYRWLCAQRGLDPVPLYAELVARYQPPRLRPPYNLAAREQAGFTAEELAWLAGEAG